jgi:hypothetical protein
LYLRIATEKACYGAFKNIKHFWARNHYYGK